MKFQYLGRAALREFKGAQRSLRGCKGVQELAAKHQVLTHGLGRYRQTFQEWLNCRNMLKKDGERPTDGKSQVSHQSRKPHQEVQLA